MIPIFLLKPLYLIGLLTLAIPFLLLLTKPKTRRVVDFSSVFFLRTILDKASNVIEWKKLLLLALRLLLLGSLSFVFTLPFIRGSKVPFLSKHEEHLVFVVDRSYGTQYQESGVSLWQQMIQKVEQIHDEHRGRKPMLSLYVFDKKVEMMVVETSDEAVFYDKLKTLEPNHFQHDFQQLQTELKHLAEEWKEGLPTSVYVLSDFSIPNQKVRESFIQKAQNASSEALQIRFFPVRPENYQNFVIDHVVLPDRPFSPNQKEVLKVSYQNHYFPPGTKKTIKVWMGQVLLAEKTIQLSEAVRGEVSLEIKFPTVGTYPIRIESDPDGLMDDHRFYAVAHVRYAMSVLMVEKKDYSTPFESPYFYFEQVLKSYEALNQSYWIETSKVSLEEFRTKELDEYDLIVLADISDLTPRIASQLRYYLKEGGKCLFGVGPSFSAEDYETSSHLKKLLGGHFSKVQQWNLEGKPFHLDPIPYQQSFLKVFEGGDFGGLEEVSFYKIQPFIPDEKNKKYQVLMWFNQKWPAFIKMQQDHGELYLWTTSLNHDWNDFPKKISFLPFIFEWLKEVLWEDQKFKDTLYIGDHISLNHVRQWGAKQVVMEDPEEQQVTLYVGKQDTDLSFKVMKPGVYQWMELSEDRQIRHMTPVNLNVPEAGGFFSDTDVADIWNMEGKLPEENLSQERAPFTSSQKIPLEIPLLAGILSLLVMESWVANRIFKSTWY